MKKITFALAALVSVMALSACGTAKTEETPVSEESGITIDYGESEIYSKDDMDKAIAEIREEFDTWEGCELHSITYAGDECVTEENISWMNELHDGANFDECIEFISSFHSPKESYGAWETDTEYEGWGWWLARSGGGDWELLSWGY